MTIIRPSFVDAISDAHYARLCRCIVVTGNLRDRFALGDAQSPAFLSLEATLRQSLTHAVYPRRGISERFVVVSVKSDGPAFPVDDDARHLWDLSQLAGNGPRGSPLVQLATRLADLLKEVVEGHPSPTNAVRMIGSLLVVIGRLRQSGVPVRPVAVIVDHAEAILPSGELGRLSATDRATLTAFYDLMRDEEIWADAATADTRPDFVILLSPTLQQLNAGIMQLPKTIHIDVPLPDEAARRAFVRHKLAEYPVTFDYPDASDPVEALVQDARGLTLGALDDVLTRAHRSGAAVGRRDVVTEVNHELQARLGNVIKIVYPDHGWDDVVGFRKLKQRLARLKRRIDNPERAPAGMTVVGPNGSGKTFICEAFAADTGRVAVTLSQIRSEWFGQTDTLAESFESVISVFGRVMVLVDEAHVAFGSIHDPHTHETEARLTRHIIQMMDNESNRGNIFWALMTTRPDLLDPDIVRRGRCSLFVPIFDPEGEDAEEFLAWMRARIARAGVELSEADVALLRERSAGFSAGDYREFVGDYLEERDFNPGVSLAEFLTSWTPSAVSLAAEREHQTLLATLRCDWRELLPARYRDVPRDAIQERIARLDSRVG